MSNMKCPFCQQELEINDLDVQLLGCENQNCKHSIHYDTVGSKELWQELIRTRKALKTAVKSIKLDKEFAEYMRTELGRTRKALDAAKEGLKRIDWCATDYGVAQDILDEITATLENQNGNC